MSFTRRLLLELIPSAIFTWFFKPEKEDPNLFLAQAPKPAPKPSIDEISDKRLCMYVAMEIMRAHGNFQSTPWLDRLFARFASQQLHWGPATKAIFEHMLLLTGIRPNSTTDGHPHLLQVYSPRYVKDIDELLTYRATGVYGKMLYTHIIDMAAQLALQGHLPIVEVMPYVKHEAFMLETFLVVTVAETRPNTFGPARFPQDTAPHA